MLVRRSAARFDGLVAWITGGGSGIGRACAVELARRGAHVVVSGRREGPLQETAALCQAHGVRTLTLAVDVTDPDAQDAAVQAIVDKFSRLDVVLANAGCSVSGRIESLSVEEWRRQLEINVIGLATTARVALPALRQTGGRLALVGSVMAYLGMPGAGAYAASKAAVRAIGDTLHLELQGSGVSCTTLQPGFVESDIARVDNAGVLDLDRPDPRPGALMWTGEAAARVMVDAVFARRRELVFTGHGRVVTWLARHAPGLLYALLASGPVSKALGR